MGNIWLDFSIFNHHKIKRLQRVLGSDGVLSLVRLWVYAGENREDGVLANMDRQDIQSVAESEEDSFVETLIKCKLLDEADGVYSIHNFTKNNPYIAEKGARKERAKLGGLARQAQLKAEKEQPVASLKQAGSKQGGSKQTKQTKLNKEDKADNDKKVKEEPQLPEWLDKGVWSEWVQYRKELKKTLTVSTIKKQLKQLEKMGIKNHVGIINQSIENGWAGLFDIKHKKRDVEELNVPRLKYFRDMDA